MSATRGLRRINGLEFWVEDAGRGEPVLCISGLGYSSWCWDEVRANLESTHRVITFDNRGTGRSGKPAGPYSMAMLADDAAAVLSDCEAGPAHVVGHSMGGYIALTLALQHPERVRSLVLIGTSAGGAGSMPVPQETQLAWQAAAGLSAEESARRTMPLSFAPGWSERHPERFESLLRRRVAYPTPPECWLAQFNACVDYVSTGVDAARIQVPALVIHGEADRVVPVENGARLAGMLPHARWVPMADVGHLPYFEREESFMTQLRTHLQQSRGEA